MNATALSDDVCTTYLSVFSYQLPGSVNSAGLSWVTAPEPCSVLIGCPGRLGSSKSILALSLPGTAPWYVGFIASVVAIGIGKAIFGGVGMNLFNPAMVGRAFVMIAFASVLAAGGYLFVALPAVIGGTMYTGSAWLTEVVAVVAEVVVEETVMQNMMTTSSFSC